MKQVFKYPLVIADYQEVILPAGAEILTIQIQHSEICLWALVDASASCSVNRGILCVGTGHWIDANRIKRYIGTIQVDYGNLIFHFFEGT